VAVQLAAAAGASVIATARPAHHERLRELGADHVFDYEREDLAEAVRAVGPPDVVLDHRLDEYFQFDAAVADVGTRVVGIGNTEPAAGFEDVAAARSKDLSIVLMSMFNTPSFAAILEQLAALLESGSLDPVVARRYDLAGAAAAQQAVLEESFLGKLVVEP
jgi:NADPH:quinone reductase-like Zn-dependent oxidoreductase